MARMSGRLYVTLRTRLCSLQSVRSSSRHSRAAARPPLSHEGSLTQSHLSDANKWISASLYIYTYAARKVVIRLFVFKHVFLGEDAFSLCILHFLLCINIPLLVAATDVQDSGYNRPRAKRKVITCVPPPPLYDSYMYCIVQRSSLSSQHSNRFIPPYDVPRYSFLTKLSSTLLLKALAAGSFAHVSARPSFGSSPG